jgi:four helix bundle protein
MDARKGERVGRRTRVERLAVELVAVCRGLSHRLDARAPALNDQLQPAAASALANVGEALEEPSRGDKRRFFRYALRSAGEVERLLAGAHRIGAIPDRAHDDARRLLRDLKLDLLRLIRWTRR